MEAVLDRMTIHGFKSIKEMDLDFGSLNVLIGANGAGKSNLISFFKLLNHILSENLQQYVATVGFADSLLYYGSKRTPQFSGTLYFSTASGKNVYHLRLSSAAQDTLIFADESIAFTQRGSVNAAPLTSLGAGQKESALFSLRGDDNNRRTKQPFNAKTARVIKGIMERWRVYHFHDTSAEAKVKKQGYINDNQYLRHDAGNLAAFLYVMEQNHEPYYRRIVSTIQSVAPFFGDFILAPNPRNADYILLNWRERGTDPTIVFGPDQLSDGTLRFIALVTLLLQPDLPEMIIIDEPELGLHPYAISVLAGLLQSISRKTQIIVSTQSVTLVDKLKPEHFIVVNRLGESSEFKRLNEEDLREWL
ncbi:MAG: AAA family ATPase, partial [Heliobacteriaceae bacterium]|nr:AAA family ATPase [Heliobacteriaceae bacterium]